MPEFQIVLHIKPEEMFCASCSLTLQNLLHSAIKNLRYEYAATDFKNKTAELVLEAESQTAAEQIAKKIAAKIAEIYTLESVTTQAYESDDITATAIPTHKTSYLSALPSLSFGLALMVAEHWALLPDDLRINLPIGLGASALSAWAGKNHFANSWRLLKSGKFLSGAMDHLISFGCCSALLYSFLLLGHFKFLKDDDNSNSYFSLPLVILGLIKLSHALRDKIQTQIESELSTLILAKNTLPRVAQLIATADADESRLLRQEENGEIRSTSNIAAGSSIRIFPNTLVPIDGKLINDSAQVQEDFYGQKGLTEKTHHALIYAGSRNRSNHAFDLVTVCVARENYIQKSYQGLKQNSVTENPLLTNTAKFFFPAVMSIAVASAITWGLLRPQHAVGSALRVFLSVIFSACPCSFGLISVLPSVMRALAFNAGILIKDPRILSLNTASDFCFDKCGTLTRGEYRFKEVLCADASQNKKYLSYAKTLEEQIPTEKRSAVAKAIIHIEATDHYECTNFSSNPINADRGGIATIHNEEVILGNRKLLEQQGVIISQAILDAAGAQEKSGFLPIFMAVNKKACALIILESVEEQEQELRPATQKVLQWLLHHNKCLHFLTGDSTQRTWELIARLNLKAMTTETSSLLAPRLLEIHAQQTPIDKQDYVQTLQAQRKNVAMIGDDNNDLPAMIQADYSLAIDALAPVNSRANAVLNNSLIGIVQLIKLAQLHQTANKICIVLAFGINITSIAFASGALYPLTGIFFDPMISGATMAGSSLLLMANIGLFKILGARQLRKYDFSEPEREFTLPQGHGVN